MISRNTSQLAYTTRLAEDESDESMESTPGSVLFAVGRASHIDWTIWVHRPVLYLTEEMKGLPLSGIMGLVDTSCRRRVHPRDKFLVSTPSLGGKYHSTVYNSEWNKRGNILNYVKENSTVSELRKNSRHQKNDFKNPKIQKQIAKKKLYHPDWVKKNRKLT